MAELFRSSLFGYSKKSVIAYVAEMNEDFSQKLLAKDMECRDTIRELKERIEALEKENAALHAGRQEVAGALIDAKTFAAELKERAEAEDQARRAKNEACRDAEQQRRQALSGHVDSLRDALGAALRSMDEELERYRLRFQAAQTEFHQNMPEGGEEEREETAYAAAE